MKAIWTVLRAELRGYLDHPTAYVLIIGFVGLALFLSLRTVFLSGLATLRPLFDLLPWLYVVFVPAMTMRSLAEERRAHTLQWLLAQPVSEAQLVVGKLLGNWLLILLALCGTLPTAVTLILVTEADPGIMVGQYVGASLMSASARGHWPLGLECDSQPDHGIHPWDRGRAFPHHVGDTAGHTRASSFLIGRRDPALAPQPL